MEPHRIEIDGIVWWERTCPDCQKNIRHTERFNARHLIKKKAVCHSCSQIGKRNSFYGKSHSEETKQQYVKVRSGSGNPMYGKASAMRGKKHTPEAIKKMSIAQTAAWERRGANPTEFERYRYKVDSLTQKQPIHLLENFKNRGSAGVLGAYHLDHIISVWYGFQNNILPEKIADISNLQMLPWLENQKKWIKNGSNDC